MINTVLGSCVPVVLLIAFSALPVPGADGVPTKKPVLPPAPEGVTIQQDVPYLAPDRAEKLDMYLPAGRPKGARSPAVVMIHGGGWAGGSFRFPEGPAAGAIRDAG